MMQHPPPSSLSSSSSASANAACGELVAVDAGSGKAGGVKKWKKSKVFAIKGCRRPAVENVLCVADGEVLTLSLALTNANDCTHFELVQVSDDPTQCVAQMVATEFADTAHIEFRTGVLPLSATYTWRVRAWNGVGPGPLSYECEHRVVDRRIEALKDGKRAAEQLARRIECAAADLRRALDAARDAIAKGNYRAQNEAMVALSLALDSARNRGVLDSVLLRDAELLLDSARDEWKKELVHRDAVLHWKETVDALVAAMRAGSNDLSECLLRLEVKGCDGEVALTSTATLNQVQYSIISGRY
jgi:hypothetical protein